MDDKGKKMIDAILPTGAATPPKKEKANSGKNDTAGKRQIVNKKALKWIFKDEDYHPNYTDNGRRFIRNEFRWLIRGVLIIGISLAIFFVASKIGDFLTWVQSWK